MVQRYALDLPGDIAPPDIAISKERLGYQPRYNFITFLQELAEQDQRRSTPAWLAGR